VIGTGLALSPIHNIWLTDLATTSKGETLVFIPALGYLILIMGVGLFILHNWEQVKQGGLGDKQIAIPLLVIVGAIGLSGWNGIGWQEKIAPLSMGVCLFASYIVARIVGKDLFVPLAVGALIASLGIILHGCIFRSQITGGFVFGQNYDIAVGYVLLGVALFLREYQWVLAGVALLALSISGSPEGVFALGVMLPVAVARRDYGRKLGVIIIPVLVVAVVWFSMGWGQELYDHFRRTIMFQPTQGRELDGDTSPSFGRSSVGNRISVAKTAMVNIKPFGEGYILTDFGKVDMVHNVPLVIVQQLGWGGILAGIAWLWVSVWCLRKTKWKYAWALVLALSVFDHYVWTQLAPIWWFLIGVSTTSGINADKIFTEVNE